MFRISIKENCHNHLKLSFLKKLSDSSEDSISNLNHFEIDNFQKEFKSMIESKNVDKPTNSM